MNPIRKHISDNQEFWRIVKVITKFPKFHNSIKADFELLLVLIEQNTQNIEIFEMLTRTGIKNLFALIEADIYYYNLIDNYKDYDDRDKFFCKFKKTFKQICKTWDKENLQKTYFSSKFSDLKDLKEIRDALTHPKRIDDIIKPTKETFDKLKNAYKAYDDFILEIMSNFFIGTEIPILEPTTVKTPIQP
jgi:hypothetical protein